MDGLRVTIMLLTNSAISVSSSVLCPIKDSLENCEPVQVLLHYVHSTSVRYQEFYECLGPDDPIEFQVCCPDECCPPKLVDPVLRIDMNTSRSLSISVIIICIVSSILIIICCFCQRCPLYNTCEKKRLKKDIIEIHLNNKQIA